MVALSTLSGFTGKPIATTILDAAEVSGDAMVFSADVLSEGIISTGQLSSDLTRAGVDFSADSATFVANAALAGIYISTDTAEFFLSQAVNIAAASGRLSGETAELAIAFGGRVAEEIIFNCTKDLFIYVDSHCSLVFYSSFY